jgi:hypothetical protein
LSQSWGFESQSRNWIYYIVNDCPGSRGRHLFCRDWSRSWLVKEIFDLERKIMMLPLKLAENQASTLNKMSALAH